MQLSLIATITVMATGTLFSLEEFVLLPDEPGKQELSEGELVSVPPPKFIHDKLSRRLYEALRTYQIGRASCRERV